MGLNYDDGIQFSLDVPEEDEIRSPFYNQGDVITIRDENNQLSTAKIIDIPITTSNPYAIHYMSSGNYDQVQEENILTLNNNKIISTSTDLEYNTINWIKHDVKVTYLSPECMKQHKQGYI